ncbi:sulfotransferase [Roseibium sp. RKSG952]|uniref:sulfotransferase family protein n=1 Tax=Roseibium sp. RKSG952 TaxID=2529384 RepID=UPI0012BC658D|nr:sulfotransferase [Roseibium sp. RKSG952]MTH95336.1 hypothetical protein [Roseibium sp. RKSG952]
MKKPNFFLIGAPKAGTTAFADYLAMHPQVFMSSIKEPHFYSSDLPNLGINDRSRYEALFADAGEQHRIVGEASVSYLGSQVALPRILEEYPNAKFLVLLRNPISMAVSFYYHAIINGWERAATFEEAWNLQPARKRGEHIPPRCSSPIVLQYKHLCSIGSQFEKVCKLVSRENLHTIVFDDFVADPSRIWMELQDFLGVDYDFREKFPKMNKRKVYRSLFWADLMWPLMRTMRTYATNKLIRYALIGTYKVLTKPSTEISMSPDFVRHLNAEFESEVSLLSSCMKRDFSHWLQEPYGTCPSLTPPRVLI